MKRTLSAGRLAGRREGAVLVAVLTGLILVLAQLAVHPQSARADYGAMIHAISGSVNSTVGGCNGNRPTHEGIDIGAASGSPIVAAYDGTVSTSVVNFGSSGYGNYVVLTHASGYTTLYAHMRDAPSVARGATVVKGQTIGVVGATGNAVGSHLHFELKRNGTNIANQGYACGQRVTRGEPIPMDFPGLAAVTTSSPPVVSKDFNSDGMADLLAVQDTGQLWAYPGTGAGAFGAAVPIGPDWQRMSIVSGGGDFTSDGRMDLVARDNDGNLWLYAGVGRYLFAGARFIGPDWQTFTGIVAGADYTGDRKADLVGRRNDGTLWIYPGDGAGGFGVPWQAGLGWNSMSALLGGADYTGDARADLVATDPEGLLWLYPGTNTGAFGGAIRVGNGWTIMTAIVGGGDYTGDGKADLLARSADGALWTYPGVGSAGFAAAIRSGSGWNIMVHMI